MHEKPPQAQSVQSVFNRIRRLAQREQRDREGCYWIEGVRNFVQASDARLHFEALIYSPILLQNDLADMLVRKHAARGVPRIRVSPEQFRGVSTTERASGVGAIVRQHWTSLADAGPTSGLCWLVCEQIRSPGNLGTILRTAEACGASGMIFLGDTTDPCDPVTVRAGMGASPRVPLVRTTHAALRDWIARHGIHMVGLSPRAGTIWNALPANGPIGLVIGEERQGLTTPMRDLCHSFVRIPMCGMADSLNVSVAAGIMMYELVRRAQPSEATGLDQQTLLDRLSEPGAPSTGPRPPAWREGFC